jgi:hypothetical protein
VDYRTNVLFVDAHSEGGRGHHQVDPILSPPLEQIATRRCRCVAIEAGDSCEALGPEARRPCPRVSTRGGIQNCGTRKTPKGLDNRCLPLAFVVEQRDMVLRLRSKALAG